MCRQFDSGPRHRTLLLEFLIVYHHQGPWKPAHFAGQRLTQHANQLVTPRRGHWIGALVQRPLGPKGELAPSRRREIYRPRDGRRVRPQKWTTTRSRVSVGVAADVCRAAAASSSYSYLAGC